MIDERRDRSITEAVHSVDYAYPIQSSGDQDGRQSEQGLAHLCSLASFSGSGRQRSAAENKRPSRCREAARSIPWTTEARPYALVPSPATT